jgi:sigma-B regulation protein RsbU (phosphoserine phosphatase)
MPTETAAPEGIASSSSSVEITIDSQEPLASAAQVLIEHLFAHPDTRIPGVSYAVAYRLAEEYIGGDIVDIYHFDNNSVAFAIADISGKGAAAAVHAALIKYGLRAYSSHGLTPEVALRAMDRLYLENNSFEKMESFATVFFGLVDPSRRLLTYANAGHEPLLLVSPHGVITVLPPTAPLIGVFDDQHHLFKQDFATIEPGGLLVATTDGVTEARTTDGEMFGMERFIEAVRASREGTPEDIIAQVFSDVETFAGKTLRDDIAIVVARFT